MNNLCPKSAVASSSQSVPDSLSDPRPNPLPFPALKPYNQSHMQPALSARISDGFMAAIWLGGEKPHQGVSSRNQAWHPAPNVCNSTTALGLQAGCAGNRVRSFCSGEQYDSDLSLYYLRARYYNPATGRFLSRDPENGNTIDPSSLHKYLYGGGDPINRIDPSGRADTIQTVFTITVITTPTEAGLVALVGGTGAQIAAWAAVAEQYAGIAYLTTQDILAFIADVAYQKGIVKLLGCATVGVAVARFGSEVGIPDKAKFWVGLAFSAACTRYFPAPGIPPSNWWK